MVRYKRIGSALLVLLAMSAVTACGKAPVDSQAGIPADEMTMKSNADLQSARQAFWQHDIEAAESTYKDITSDSDASADAWGELGNVYYLQGKWKEAAAAYTEAALKLIDNRQTGQAMHLHQLVMRMDGEQASRIDEKLRAEFQAQMSQ